MSDISNVEISLECETMIQNILIGILKKPFSGISKTGEQKKQ